jgi:phage N-6-adenine-methyltransferase
VKLFEHEPLEGHRPGRGGIGAHHTKASTTTDVWLTPRWVIDRFGPFDLDPCAADPRPWDCAATNLTEGDDGLTAEWNGHVWLNPPYSNIAPWMERLAAHRNGMALVFARTDTAWWHDHVFPAAASILFLRGRLSFCDPAGIAAKHNSGGPSALIAYGRLANAKLLDFGPPLGRVFQC